MKLTLQQAYERATKGPLATEIRNNPRGPVCGIVANDSEIRHVGTAHSKIDAALLAHAFNVLPEVVGLMEETIAVLNGQWNEGERKAQAMKIHLMLAKASTVEVPE